MGFNVTGLVTTPWHYKIMCHSGLGDFWGAGLGKFNSYKRWKEKKKKKQVFTHIDKAMKHTCLQFFSYQTA